MLLRATSPSIAIYLDDSGPHGSDYYKLELSIEQSVTKNNITRT